MSVVTREGNSPKCFSWFSLYGPVSALNVLLFVFLCFLNFLQEMGKKSKSESHIQLFETPMDLSPPGSSVHGILQARTLEWVATSFSRASSQPSDQIWVSRIAGRFFTLWATRVSTTIGYHFAILKKMNEIVCQFNWTSLSLSLFLWNFSALNLHQGQAGPTARGD